MTEDKIQNLLQKADETAGRPTPISINLSTVRHRANRRRIVGIAAAVAILVAFSLWSLTSKTVGTKQQQKITLLEAQLRHLQARADATFDLVKEALENERKQNQLDELQAQLASIPDPIEEIQEQIDKTTFILIYQADRMYRELNLKRSAIQTYKRVIELFPETHGAEVARQRLTEIRNNKYKRDSKGDLLWKPQNASSSC
jgi:cell division protein FtsB